MNYNTDSKKPPEEITPHLKSHFLNLYSMALSDMEFNSIELEFLYKFGKSRGVSEVQIEELLLRPDLVPFSVPEDLMTKMEYLYDFAQMIWADGIVEENERVFLCMFIKKFGFQEDNIDALADFLLKSAKEKMELPELLSIVKQNI